MPNIKSAIKRVRTTETAEARNISQKNAMRTAVKNAKSAIDFDVAIIGGGLVGIVIIVLKLLAGGDTSDVLNQALQNQMQNIEPYYNWRHLYTAEEDKASPFYGRTYSEFEFSQTVYNYYIHPQWDFFGSKTLYLKLLFVDYEHGYAIIELLGEWNDAIENDIMTLRRDITDNLYALGINKYMLIAENVLNFHSSDADYYEEWREQIEEDGGWIVILNMPEQSQYDFKKARLTNYLTLMDFEGWRTLKPWAILYRATKSISLFLQMCGRGSRVTESKKDFIHKMGICLKELRETFNCLKIIERANLTSNAELINKLKIEVNELISIFVSSIKTAKTNSEIKNR